MIKLLIFVLLLKGSAFREAFLYDISTILFWQVSLFIYE